MLIKQAQLDECVYLFEASSDCRRLHGTDTKSTTN